jgi:hypothetical protein
MVFWSVRNLKDGSIQLEMWPARCLIRRFTVVQLASDKVQLLATYQRRRVFFDDLLNKACILRRNIVSERTFRQRKKANEKQPSDYVYTQADVPA